MNDKSIPKLGSIYDPLMKFITSQKKWSSLQDVKQLKKNLKEYFFIQETRSLKEFFDGRKDKALNHHKLAKIRQLHFGFGIPYYVFHSELREEHIFTKHSPRLSYLKEFVPLNYKGTTRREEQEYIARYIKGMKKYIEEGHKNFKVYEYLGKGRQLKEGIALKYYEEVQREIFKMMEKQLQDHPNMQYIRFLALPFTTNNLLESKGKKKEYFIKALQECSLEVFKHICRVFQMKNQERINFYIVWRPTRVYHYGIIDDKYIVSEYYRYKRGGDFVPDLLFVQDVSDENYNPLGDLLRIYNAEITSKLTNDNRERSIKFSLDDFKIAIIDAEKVTNETFKKKSEHLTKAELKEEKVNKTKREYNIWMTKKKVMDAKLEAYKDIFKLT